jgi:hypothetical protein
MFTYNGSLSHKFFLFFNVYRNLDPDANPHLHLFSKLDPDPHKVDADPKHCLLDKYSSSMLWNFVLS